MPFQPRTKEIERPLCGCGKPVMYRGKTVLGFTIWKSGCATCQKAAIKKRKDKCEKCGNKNDLQTDHIDGDRSNNNSYNLQTLCHPCHNIKTTENNEWRWKK
jgi:hypothetical protein